MNEPFLSIPEDLTLHWASLARDLEQHAREHGGQEMTFGIIVRNGRITEVLESTYRTREPRGTLGKMEARPWWSVIRRLRSVSNARDSMVQMSIDLDLNCSPVCWRAPEVKRLEPKRARSK